MRAVACRHGLVTLETEPRASVSDSLEGEEGRARTSLAGAGGHKLVGMLWLAVVTRFILGFVGAFLGLYIVLALVVLVTGGTLIECDRGDCGAVGEWWHGHSRLVGGFVVAVAALVGCLVALRRFRQEGGTQPREKKR
jgi:uncharacterized membrane protein